MESEKANRCPEITPGHAEYRADLAHYCTFFGANTLSTPPEPDLAAWFISESSSAPLAGDAAWSSRCPVPTFFGGLVTMEIPCYVKDSLGNVQQTGACHSVVVP